MNTTDLLQPQLLESEALRDYLKQVSLYICITSAPMSIFRVFLKIFNKNFIFSAAWLFQILMIYPVQTC